MNKLPLAFALMLPFAAPVGAQVTPQAIVSEFMTACPEALGDPEAFLATTILDENTSGTMTADRALIFVNGINPENETTIAVFQSQFDGGVIKTCTLSSFQGSGGVRLDPEAVHAALDGVLTELSNVSDIVEVGGPVSSDGDTGIMARWSTPEFPPRYTVQATLSEVFVSITFTMILPSQ